MPTLIAGGDSFTWGNELPDQYMDHLVNLPSKLTWSSRIAQHFNWDYYCVAKPGSGNNSITRRVIAEVSRRPTEELYVAVMWTYTHRSEIRLRNMKPYNTVVKEPIVAARYDIDNFWINFNSWHGLTFEEKMEFFPKDIQPERYQFFRDQHDEMTRIGITDASRYFYSPTGDNYYHQYNFLKEINLLQYYLQNKNIKYFFCLASNEILNPDPTVINESGLWETINWKNWFKEIAFHPWTKEKKYQLNGSHPNEAAHQDWLQLILPKVQECFQK
ncbi:MAG: hypothetical protein RLZZ44_851 [Bacteroidota bacterium]|jgi:hypothetical protein